MALEPKWVAEPPPQNREQSHVAARLAELLDHRRGHAWAELDTGDANHARDCAQWLRKRGYEATVRGPVLYARAKP